MKNHITVLLTNDDGIEAPGIKAIRRAFESQSNAVIWTVAPDRGKSTSSHAMSIARPVFAKELEPRVYAVDGLPVDCVYLALFHLIDCMPDVVVSGINKGANLGRDVIYSGTVACAREAALGGVHGIAASLVDGDDYDEAAKSVCEIACRVARLKDKPILLNLNYPKGPFDGPKPARLGIRNYPRVVSKRNAPIDNQEYFWLGGPAIQDEEIPGTDGWLIGKNTASATLLALDQTDSDKMSNAASLLPFIGQAGQE